jgi:hypothetical protein
MERYGGAVRSGQRQSSNSPTGLANDGGSFIYEMSKDTEYSTVRSTGSTIRSTYTVRSTVQSTVPTVLRISTEYSTLDRLLRFIGPELPTPGLPKGNGWRCNGTGRGLEDGYFRLDNNTI